jgi:hypothetical protein
MQAAATTEALPPPCDHHWFWCVPHGAAVNHAPEEFGTCEIRIIGGTGSGGSGGLWWRVIGRADGWGVLPGAASVAQLALHHLAAGAAGVLSRAGWIERSLIDEVELLRIDLLFLESLPAPRFL